MALYMFFFYVLGVYGSNETMYESSSSIGLESNLDSCMDEMLLSQTGPGGPPPPHESMINPIDKLYSMQNSYFSTD